RVVARTTLHGAASTAGRNPDGGGDGAPAARGGAWLPHRFRASRLLSFRTSRAVVPMQYDITRSHVVVKSGTRGSRKRHGIPWHALHRTGGTGWARSRGSKTSSRRPGASTAGRSTYRRSG